MLFGGWTRKKPEFDGEFLLITASEDVRSNEWCYSFYRITKCDGPEGWYYGIVCEDGYEWGDRDDLRADLYKKIPTLA